MAEAKNAPIHRYTNLASALHVLKHNCLTLLDPEGWEDRNDREFIRRFRDRSDLKSVLALCLTSASETHHHWSVFASGTDGVRLVFDRRKLEQSVENDKNVELKEVKYEKIQDLEGRKVALDELPYLKRYPYRAEAEERLLFKSTTAACRIYSLKLVPRTIKQVVVSPRLPPALAEVTKAAIKDASVHDVRVHRSTLLGNDRWMQLAES